MAAFSAKLEELFKNHWYAVTLGILCFPFFCFMLGSLGFLIKIPLTKWHGVAAFLLTTGVVWYLSESKKVFSINLAWVLGILLACILFSSFSCDRTWDGKSYHKPTTVFLADGWNPVWQENLREFTDANDITWWEHLTHAHHFAKGVYTASAVLYLMTGNMDSGDYINVVFIFAVFAVSLVVFRQWLKLRKTDAVIASILTAANPIAISNLHNGHVDGMLGSTLILFVLSGIAYLKTGSRQWIPLMLLTAIFGCNIKFTAVPYFGVVGVIYSLAFLVDQLKKDASCAREFRRPTTVAWFSVMFGILFAVLLLGVHPYITNTLKYSSPFYPLHSLNQAEFPAEDIMSGCYQMDDFREATSIQRFIFSYLIAQPSGLAQIDHFTIKVMDVGGTPAIGHVGGFGWIFGLCLIFTFGLLFFLWGSDRWLVLLAIAASIAVQPHNWFARFVPQMWFIPIFVFACIRMDTYQYPRLERRSSYFMGGLAFLLLLLPLHCFYDICTRSLYSLQFDRQLESYITEHPGGTVIICSPNDKGTFSPVRTWDKYAFYLSRLLQDNGIIATVVANEEYLGIDEIAAHRQIYHRYNLYCISEMPVNEKTYAEISLIMAGADKSKIPVSLWQTAKLRVWQLKKVWIGE